MCSDTTHCLDRKCKWCNIQQKDFAGTCITCKLTTLNRSTDCNTLIRVDTLERILACQLLNHILNSDDTCRTTDQKYLIKLCCCQICILQCCLYRNSCLIYQMCCQFIKLCTCQIHIKVLWTILGSCDEWKVDVCCCC